MICPEAGKKIHEGDRIGMGFPIRGKTGIQGLEDRLGLLRGGTPTSQPLPPLDEIGVGTDIVTHQRSETDRCLGAKRMGNPLGIGVVVQRANREMLPVVQLGRVENGRSAVDGVPVEGTGQGFEIEEAVFGIGMTEPDQVVLDGDGQITRPGKRSQTHRTIALGQRDPAGVDQEGKMAVERRAPRKRTGHEQLTTGVAQVIDSAENMRDPHLAIINQIGQEKHGLAVPPTHHKIPDGSQLLMLGTVHQIVPIQRARPLNPPAPGRRFTCPEAPCGFRGRQSRTPTRIAGSLPVPPLLLEIVGQLPIGAKTRVDAAQLPHLSQDVRISNRPFRLAVRSRRPTAIRPLLPGDPEPGQIRQEHCLVAGITPHPIRILNPDDERTAHPQGREIVEKRRSGVAQVEGPGGAWSKTESRLGAHDDMLAGLFPLRQFHPRSGTGYHGAPMADYFIADLHLDPKRPAGLDAFGHWLERIHPDLGSLYILGDLFEAWIGDDASDPLFDPLLDRLAGLAGNHHRLYFMPGNRDFLVGHALARRAGWTALEEPARIQCYGTPVGLLHGDTFCTEDQAYQAFRAQVRNPDWQRQFLSRPPAERHAMAAAARKASQQHNARAADDLMDVTQAAIDEFMRQENLTCLVHGHTHRPAIHRWMLDHVPRTRIVLGDWYEQGQVLRWDQSGYRLETVRIRPDPT